MKIKDIEELLFNFSKLHKSNREITFMEICKHPKSRFEEICSRVLSFYIQPSNEHNLKDLFLKSIFQIIEPNNNFLFDEKISVETEVYYEQKYLDLLITSEYFTLGIENKIGANVYNPLDVYKQLIESKKTEKKYKIVLSHKKIVTNDEIKWIKENDFIIIYYSELFAKIKSNIGNYIQKANSKYVVFLYDFINTLETDNNMKLNQEPMDKFFFDNSKKIDEFIKEYDKYKISIRNNQNSNLKEILQKLKEETDGEWWIYQNFDLGINSFVKNGHRIGLESNYEVKDYDTLKVFRIYITTWNLDDWDYFKDRVLSRYSEDDRFLDTQSRNRAYLHMDVIYNDDKEQIIKKLIEYYNFLVELVE